MGFWSWWVLTVYTLQNSQRATGGSGGDWRGQMRAWVPTRHQTKTKKEKDKSPT
nr:hypothetical protein Iba_chr06bCG2100 [Ipomoea batatas]